MENKINIRVAVGVIILVAIIFGGLIWLYSYKNFPVMTSNNSVQTKKITEKKEIRSLNIPSDWKLYKHDILGIEFYYPEKWGEPITEPVQHITNLTNVLKDFGGYDNYVVIKFHTADTPEIRIFNENFKIGPGVQVYDYYYGMAGNIADLKKSGNICDYTVDFRFLTHQSIKETASECNDGVKEILTQNKEVFDFGNFGTLYTYGLTEFAYKKLQNGFFDNVFIRFGIANSGQIEESSMTKDGLLDLKKINKSDYEQVKNEFTLFAASLSSYKPIIPEKGVFKNISGEDHNLTTIRKYYFELANGNLEAAYDYYKEKSISFDEFKGWYQNTYYANPTQFKKIGKNQYEFFVDFQDHNQDPQRYRVRMEAADGKIRTISSEEIIGEKAVFKNKSAFAKFWKGKNSVILSENGKERVIDEAEAPTEDNLMGISFSEPTFSPNGNYISYFVTGWEWYATRIYDLKKNKMVLQLSMDNNNGFTPDEKYLYACANSGFSGEQYGNVYKLPELEVQYNFFDDIKDENFMNLECSYDEAKKAVIFTLSDYYDSQNGQDDPNQTKIIEYSLLDKKAKLLQQ